MRLALQILRTVGAVLLFALALLTLFPVPVEALQLPAAVATEWGHLIAGFAALLLLTGAAEPRGVVSFMLATTTIALAGSPVLRAALLAGELPPRAGEALGPLPADAALDAPFSLRRLFGARPSGPPPEAHTFREGGGERLVLALHRGVGEGPRPVVVFVHDGGWTGGSPTDRPELAHHLAGLGYSVVIPDYRLAPAHPYPAARTDVRDAIGWIRREGRALGLDADRITLVGRGEGGHLALLVAYADRPAGVIGVAALYAPTDLEAAWNESGVRDDQALLQAFLGGAPGQSGGEYAAASPLHRVDAGVAPTLLVHGARDQVVPVDHARRLAERLESVGAEHLYVELGWGTHGCDVNLRGPCGQIVLWSLERFLARTSR